MFGDNLNSPAARDTLNEDLNAVVAYLHHAQKTDHANAVLSAIRRLAGSDEQIGRLETQVANTRERSSNGYYDPREQQQTLQIPVGTRKVSIEL